MGPEEQGRREPKKGGGFAADTMCQGGSQKGVAGCLGMFALVHPFPGRKPINARTTPQAVAPMRSTGCDLFLLHLWCAGCCTVPPG